jgi:hypothetical protein
MWFRRIRLRTTRGCSEIGRTAIRCKALATVKGLAGDIPAMPIDEGEVTMPMKGQGPSRTSADCEEKPRHGQLRWPIRWCWGGGSAALHGGAMLGSDSRGCVRRCVSVGFREQDRDVLKLESAIAPRANAV